MFLELTVSFVQHLTTLRGFHATPEVATDVSEISKIDYASMIICGTTFIFNIRWTGSQDRSAYLYNQF
jgi:hypothetical protein